MGTLSINNFSTRVKTGDILQTFTIILSKLCAQEEEDQLKGPHPCYLPLTLSGQQLDQGWPNHCPGKKMPAKTFSFAPKLFENFNY